MKILSVVLKLGKYYKLPVNLTLRLQTRAAVTKTWHHFVNNMKITIVVVELVAILTEIIKLGGG